MGWEVEVGGGWWSLRGAAGWGQWEQCPHPHPRIQERQEWRARAEKAETKVKALEDRLRRERESHEIARQKRASEVEKATLKVPSTTISHPTHSSPSPSPNLIHSHSHSHTALT